jgi:Ca2+-binding EF-hand superfamily protein
MRNSISCLLATAALLAAAGPSFAAGTAPSHTPTMMAAQDADQDGRLTLDEMRRARQQQVERFDADRDGKLSAAEYQTMWLDAAQARLARAFADDKDHDGAVTADEMIARASDLLHRRDSDKDGALTAEELRPRRRATPAG